MKTLQAEYARLLICGNTDGAYAMERQYALDGYPPELVSVGLKALDDGQDPEAAIGRAFDAAMAANPINAGRTWETRVTPSEAWPSPAPCVPRRGLGDPPCPSGTG